MRTSYKWWKDHAKSRITQPAELQMFEWNMKIHSLFLSEGGGTPTLVETEGRKEDAWFKGAEKNQVEKAKFGQVAHTERRACALPVGKRYEESALICGFKTVPLGFVDWPPETFCHRKLYSLLFFQRKVRRKWSPLPHQEVFQIWYNFPLLSKTTEGWGGNHAGALENYARWGRIEKYFLSLPLLIPKYQNGEVPERNWSAGDAGHALESPVLGIILYWDLCPPQAAASLSWEGFSTSCFTCMISHLEFLPGGI